MPVLQILLDWSSLEEALETVATRGCTGRAQGRLVDASADVGGIECNHGFGGDHGCMQFV